MVSVDAFMLFRGDKNEKQKSREHCVITMTMRGCTFFNYVLLVVKSRAAGIHLGTQKTAAAAAMGSQRELMFSK